MAGPDVSTAIKGADDAAPAPAVAAVGNAVDYADRLLGLLPGSRRTPGLKDLLSAAGAYLPADQVERIRQAAEFGAEAHRGQKRKTGEPYIAHPVAAAEILAELRVDADTHVEVAGGAGLARKPACV